MQSANVSQHAIAPVTLQLAINILSLDRERKPSVFLLYKTFNTLMLELLIVSTNLVKSI